MIVLSPYLMFSLPEYSTLVSYLAGSSRCTSEKEKTAAEITKQ